MFLWVFRCFCDASRYTMYCIVPTENERAHDVQSQPQETATNTVQTYFHIQIPIFLWLIGGPDKVQRWEAVQLTCNLQVSLCSFDDVDDLTVLVHMDYILCVQDVILWEGVVIISHGTNHAGY